MKRYGVVMLVTMALVGLSVVPAEALPVQVVWAARAGGGPYAWDEGLGIDVDDAGNAYVTGVFDDDGRFGPFTVPGAGGFGDAFMAKLDSTGSYVWVGGVGGAGYDEGRGVAVDGAGNSYWTGLFRGTADFDPGPGTFDLTSAGRDDVYLVKLDPDGELIWAQRFGDGGGDRGNNVAVDDAGHVYLARGGYLAKIAEDGSMVWQRTPGVGEVKGVALDQAGNVHVVGRSSAVVKFGPDGDLVWLASTDDRGVYGAGAWGAGIDVDGQGNVYTTGGFGGTVDFDPGPGVFDLDDPGDWGRLYVWKLDRNGNIAWADARRGPAEGYGVAVDGDGNAYTTGWEWHYSSIDLENIYLTKHDAQGNLVREVSLSSEESDVGYAIAVDEHRNVYVTGTFTNEVDLDPGPGEYWLTYGGGFEMFVWVTSGWLDCGGLAPSIVGTDDDDVLVGTSGPDVIHGLGGNDEIRGMSGDDVVCGGGGHDVLRGDGGQDVLIGGLGNDMLLGSGGADRLDGGVGRDLLRGQGGADAMWGGDGSDVLVGGSGHDEMYGGGAGDELRGGDGNDVVHGEGGSDTLTGGPGIDTLDGGGGTDSCAGGEAVIQCEA